jgi:hypothetical protein
LQSVRTIPTGMLAHQNKRRHCEEQNGVKTD